jgi:hypothetical protein
VNPPQCPPTHLFSFRGNREYTEQVIATSDPKYVTIGYHSVEWPVSIVDGAIALSVSFIGYESWPTD